MEVLAIIPARSGSKSVPHKNIMSVNGKPMMAHSIEHARASRYINRIIVSTDDAYYAELAQSFGAETPFLRPMHIAADLTTDFEVFEHALAWLETHQNYRPDIVVHLRPTTPVRDPEDIDRMIEMLMQYPDFDSVRSVAPAPETPFKMWFMDGNVLKPVCADPGIHEPYNQPRQALPKVYLQNASIDICRATTITEKKSMTGDRILGYVMDNNYDIDDPQDFAKLPGNAVSGTKHKVFCFDIDGVIAQLSPDNNYGLAQPNTTVIEKINALFDNGNYIILFTARGSKTGLNWMEVTERQMRTWGVKYHELKFGKPAADYYVDDRMLSLNLFI